MKATDDGEIRSLLARLAHLADTGDVNEYVALFDDEAVWAMPAIPQTGLPASERRGRAAIEEGVRDRRASGVQGPGTNTAHLVTTVDVQYESDDVAIAESCWQFIVDTASAPRLQSFGRYRDTVRRSGDGWKLARREITVG